MPKVVNHAQRCTEITEAAWRVLVRGGTRAVSVRNVAAEAGLATASLRRTFPTQSALLTACLTLMGERAAARIRALPPDDDAVELALAQLGQTLPLDQERQVEMEVYVALGAASLADVQLHVAFAELIEGFRALCRLIVVRLSPDVTESNLAVRTAHLHALVDGLALHLLHGAEPDDAVAILRAHLSALAAGH